MNNKVLFVISSLGGGGAQRVLLHVANEMADRGLEVRILKTGSRKTGAYAILPEIEIIQVPRMSGPAPVRAIRMLRFMRGVFRQYANHTVISFLSDNNMLSIVASLGLGNRVVVCERNDPAQNCGNQMLRRMRNLLYHFADWNVFQTEDMKNYFARSIRQKGTVIPNPVLMDTRRYEGITDHYRRVLAAGRLTAQKNYEMMLQAFAVFHEIHPEYTLEIYGDGERKQELERQICSSGMEGSVHIYAFSEDIYRLMKESMMYVSSSNFEGISNTMLEAMALGVPTIVTDCPIGGARMVIQNGENGLLVPVKDHVALAAAMCRVAEDVQLRERLSANSVKVLETYNIKRITDLWLEVL